MGRAWGAYFFCWLSHIMLKARKVSASRPIPISSRKYNISTSDVVYLLIGVETSKVHGVALNQKVGLQHMSQLDLEECELTSTKDLNLTNECASVSPGDNVYLIYHSKEFMGISKSLGGGAIDMHHKIPKYISNSLQKAQSYIDCNEEYASQYDEKLELVIMKAF